MMCLGGGGVMHMCELPGLVRLDLGVGGGLDGDSGEVLGVVSCEMGNYLCFCTPPNLGTLRLHNIAAV